MIHFPDIVDGTMRDDFLVCPTYAKRMYIEHIVPAEFTSLEHARTVFRGALAVARKEYHVKHHTAHVARDHGRAYIERKWASRFNALPLRNLLAAFDNYLAEWPLGTDGLHPAMYESRPLIGETVLLPLPVLHPLGGEQLRYAVYIDMLAVEADTGALVIVCDNLNWTSADLGNSDLRADITEKFYAAHSLLIGREFLAEVRASSAIYGCRRATTYRLEWMRDQWYRQVSSDFSRMVGMYHHRRFDQALSHVCQGCEYKPFCVAETPADVYAKFIPAQWCAKTAERKPL